MMYSIAFNLSGSVCTDELTEFLEWLARIEIYEPESVRVNVTIVDHKPTDGN